jgi:hypothetical protein
MRNKKSESMHFYSKNYIIQSTSTFSFLILNFLFLIIQKMDIHILEYFLPALNHFSFTFVVNQTRLNESPKGKTDRNRWS